MQTLLITHIGTRWPHYLRDCFHQARLVNPVSEVNIVFLVNFCHFEEVTKLQELYSITPCYIEELCASKAHEEFERLIENRIDITFRNKYWRYVVERFFVVEEYLQKYQLSNVYMIETDNMVYIPLKLIKTTETLFTQGIALPFDRVEEGYPTFMFFRTPTHVSEFVDFIIDCMKHGVFNDMQILGKYRNDYPSRVFSYPVLPHECNNPPRARKSLIGHTATSEQGRFLTDSRFPVIFDAAVYGQFIGGIDPCNSKGANSLGFVNESALYSIQETRFGWGKYNNLWVPVANDIPVMNLHIHSKALSYFRSDSVEIPQAKYDPKELETRLTKEFTA